MIDVIVVIANTGRKGENLGWEDVYVNTRVIRFEFEDEDDVLDWLRAASVMVVSSERLKA
jgi:hypothetical protein